MSLLSALNTGAGGLDANSLELSVIGDNIANASTIGFKSSRAVFQDQLARTILGQGPAQVGLGTRVQAVQRIITQGSLLTTARATDVAIDGNGLFMVQGAFNGRTARYYTRNGQFTLDKDGFLTNLYGLKVQGFAADATGKVGTALGDLQIGTSSSAPLATSTVTMRANLQADAPIVGAFNVATPTTTSNYATSVAVYDSLGRAHQVDTYFRRTGNGAWEYHSLTDGGGLNGGVAGTPTEIASGNITFGTNGQLTGVIPGPGTFSPLGATAPQPLTLNFGTSTAAGGTGLDGLTQFANPSVSSFMGQDGYPSGDLASVSVNTQGQMIGAFTNGHERVIGQIGIAKFTAEEKMERVGGNLYVGTIDAGTPTIGTPGTGGYGSVVAGALEQSNVDMSSEFVRMIAAQRGFQANAKTLSTADNLLAELMNLKR